MKRMPAVLDSVCLSSFPLRPSYVDEDRVVERVQPRRPPPRATRTRAPTFVDHAPLRSRVAAPRRQATRLAASRRRPRPIVNVITRLA